MKLKILHTNFHRGWGGQAARVFYLCRQLVKMGYDVTVAAPQGSVLTEKCQAAGVPTLETVRFSKGFRPMDFINDVKTLRRFMVTHGTEILHTHGSQDTWSGCTAASLCRKRPLVVRTRHNTFPVKYTLVNRMLHRRWIDWLVVVSDSVVERYSRFIEAGIVKADRITTIHSSLQVERFDPDVMDGQTARDELGLSKDTPVLVVSARLASEKGHKFLLDAMPTILKAHPDAVLILAGEGNQESALREQVTRLGIEGNVRFLGFRSDVPSIIASADVCVLPSIDCDASSAAIKEAMAMRKPVVATRIGGAPEIIDDGVTGVIVPPADSDALAMTISRLLADPQQRLEVGNAAREEVIEHYTEARLAEETAKVYEAVIEAGPRR